jgi:hypothetical protein
MWAVMLLKMRKSFFMSHKLYIPTDPIILSNFITDSSFFNFQLDQAFALPPAQVSKVHQPFYFQSTSVNYHCHLSDTQHNISELNTDTIFKKRSNTLHILSQLCYSHHGHWNKTPWPTTVKNPRDPKKDIHYSTTSSVDCPKSISHCCLQYREYFFNTEYL